mmetsp:Transcript_32867/g.95081  ORF Transcript_32867/g.95081 Transcript_32867/m.95081 type:complete len:237 (+) Transcript_32867:352-1062(+)
MMDAVSKEVADEAKACCAQEQQPLDFRIKVGEDKEGNSGGDARLQDDVCKSCWRFLFGEKVSENCLDRAFPDAAPSAVDNVEEPEDVAEALVRSGQRERCHKYEGASADEHDRLGATPISEPMKRHGKKSGDANGEGGVEKDKAVVVLRILGDLIIVVQVAVHGGNDTSLDVCCDEGRGKTEGDVRRDHQVALGVQDQKAKGRRDLIKHPRLGILCRGRLLELHVTDHGHEHGCTH